MAESIESMLGLDEQKTPEQNIDLSAEIAEMLGEPVVEEPIAEAQPEPASSPEPTTIDTEPKVEEPTAPVVAEPNLEELAQQFLRDKYNIGIDELESKLKPAEEPFADDLIRKLNEYRANGGEDLEAFLRLQKTDFNAIDPLAGMREKFRMENPDLTSDEVELLLQDTYKLDADEFDERTIKLAEIRLRKDWQSAKVELQALQAKPVENTARQEQAQINEQQAAQVAEWNKLVEQSTKDFTELRLAVNGQEVPVAVENRDKVKAAMSDFTNLFQDRWMKEGKPDVATMMKDIALIYNQDKVSQATFAEGKSNGIAEFKNQLHNPSSRGGTAAPTPSGDLHDMLGAAFAKAVGGR